MLEELSNEIAGSVKAEGYKIDPITILTIISIIITVWRNCRPTQARINKPSFIDRWRLRRVVKAEFSKSTTPNKKYAQEVYEAVLNRAQTLTDKEYHDLGNSIQNLK